MYPNVTGTSGPSLDFAVIRFEALTMDRKQPPDAAAAAAAAAQQAQQQTIPLWITPISHNVTTQPSNPSDDDNELLLSKGRYHVIQRVISASPNRSVSEAEIQTTLEAFVSTTGETLWRRVAISSIYEMEDATRRERQQGLHVSFMLPKQDMAANDVLGGNETTTTTSSNLFCWTAFSDRPSHKFLCVLVQPSLLGIWDVYPEATTCGNERSDWTVGEGNSVALPFECCSIFALGDVSGGILLQRKETKEDRNEINAYRGWNGGIVGTSQDEDDNMFVLKDPPRPVRWGKLDHSPATSAVSHRLLPATPKAGSHASSVPKISSLFSLLHPLDDVLPVSLLPDSAANEFTGAPCADVFEKVLLVDVLRWTDHNDGYCEKQEYFQTICVTYNTQLRRHAIWAIKNAPPPPETPPLWQQSRQWRCEDDWSTTFLGTLDQEDMEILGVGAANDAAAIMSISRDDALADALGVRRTPRKAVHDMSSVPPRNLSTVAVRKSRRQSEGGHAGVSSMLLSPPPTGNPSMHTKDHGDDMDVDLNVDAEAIMGAPPLLSFAALSGLHPRLGLGCLYEEDCRSEQAENCFLASNLDGSGSLVICLCCPVKGKENPYELKLFLATPRKEETGNSDSRDYSFSIQQLKSLSCISAQPIQATSIPHCFRPHVRLRNDRYDRRTTDILVLAKSTKVSTSTTLSLNRSGVFIVDCSISDVGSDKHEMNHMSICDICHPVRDRVDIILVGEKNNLMSLRGKVSLIFSADALAERVLEAVDSAIFSWSVRTSKPRGIEAAFQLRANCVRLAQMASCGRQATDDSSLIGKPCWSAVETVLLNLYKHDVVVADTRKTKLLGKENSDEAWAKLIQSDFHNSYQANDFDGLFLGFDDISAKKIGVDDGLEFLERELGAMGKESGSNLSSIDPAFMAVVFDSLHLLYEDFKLSTSIQSADWLRLLGSFLAHVCALAKTKSSGNAEDTLRAYLDYYIRDLGFVHQGEIQKKRSLRRLPQRLGSRKKITAFGRPPSFLAWVDSMLKRETPTGNHYSVCNVDAINAACQTTRSLHRIFTTLFTDLTDSHRDVRQAERSRDQLIVTQMIEEGFTDSVWVRDELPVGISLPLLEVLHRCRCDPEVACSSRLPSSGWSLIGRPDLSANMHNDLRSTRSSPGRVASEGDTLLQYDGDEESSFEDKDKDGIVPIELSSSVLFPEDNRVREVGRLLRSSRPVFLRVHRAVEVSDHDYERLKQSQLMLLCQRVLAQPVGRGMFTLGNLRPIPAEPLPVPNLCLAGRVPPTNATLALDLSEAPAEMKMWPEFNNGVAAGLRIPLNRNHGDSPDITRSWIVYNKPVSANQAQTDGANSTSQQNNLANLGHAHGGLLMALGLRGHLATLNVADVYEYLAHGTMTTTVGVLLGLAANKRGTCDISVSKMLCLHIPTLIPQHFSSSIEVASPVQAAAVAGAGLLFQGSSHRMMTEFFLNELGRRPDSDVHVDRDAYTLSCGLALGMINLCQGESIQDGGKAGLADLQIEDRLHRYVVGGVDDDEMRRRRETSDRFSVPSLSAGENEKCSRIFEGDTINTDVSAPGATLALGLMYMKSGSKTMAASLALPDTHFLLEYVRPDFLMLRVIARSLILWDEVLPTRMWIDSQVPTVVLTAYKGMRESVEKATNFSDLSCSANNQVSSETSRSSACRREQNFDRQAVRQIYSHVITAACFGIGLRFAGTGDKRAALAITECLKELRCLRDENDPISVALRPERQVLEMCLGCAAISLALVLAGSGDLNALRLFKILRWRCEDKVTYGTHMAFSSAIGLLFLGGGTCTVGREPEDVAALVLAFFPRFPSSSSDNLFHLQALRHMYALAVKEKELRAIDIDTKQSVFVPIEVHFEDESEPPLQLQSPCLLMNTDQVPKEIRIVSERYYPVRLPLSKDVMGRSFFVKKRSYFVTTLQGPPIHRLLRTQQDCRKGEAFQDLIKSITDDPRVLSFAAHISNGWAGSSSPLSVFEFCAQALQECLTVNAEEAIPLFLSLRSAVLSIENGVSSTSQSVWDMRLIQTYYKCRPNFVSDASPRILNQQLVASLIDMLERYLVTFCQKDDLVEYLNTQQVPPSADARRLGKVLTYFDSSVQDQRARDKDSAVDDMDTRN